MCLREKIKWFFWWLFISEDVDEMREGMREPGGIGRRTQQSAQAMEMPFGRNA